MEYAYYLIREAERRQESKETPYDKELADAEYLKDCIVGQISAIRDAIGEYHNKYRNTESLSEVLLEADNGLSDEISNLIGDIETRIEQYNPKDDNYL